MEIVIHIVCSSDEAYREIEKICQKHGNNCYIDNEQSLFSWVQETSGQEC